MRIRTGIVLGLLLAMGLAGCGRADNGDGVATAGGPGSSPTATARAGGQSEQDLALRFGQCMRDNGVPDFPDPRFNEGGGMSIDAPEGSDPQKVDAAMQKCKQYMPNGGEPPKLDPQMVEQNRKLAQCMRDHGVKNFPDPGPDGGIQMNGNLPGMDPDDPTFKAAMTKCQKLVPPAPSGGGPGNDTRGGGI